MNDLGLKLAWSSAQVSLVLLAASALHALASRRSPASGAWVAALGLGLVAPFTFLTLAPGGGAAASPRPGASTSNPAPAPGGGDPAVGRPLSDDGGPVWSFAGLRGVWERFETTASVPAGRCRRWGGALAFVTLTGAGLGVLRLLAGVWSIRDLRRRSRPVNDPGLNALLEELRGVLGCRRRVEVRETPELTTPATAGWWRAVVLLPDDWRSWDDHERRAVLAHEFAHVCRGDYATGLLARFALALHFYHPLVHRLAGRLLLEQELAADALGARFAGGSALYLQSLSRLALRQDGRSPCWPARAFLPAKGTLIRRIAMLRQEPKASDRPWSGPCRASAASLLLGIAAGVSLLPGPARGSDPAGPAAPASPPGGLTAAAAERGAVEPFDLSHLPDDAQGVVAVRPSAVFRRSGMGTYRTMLNLLIAQQWSKAANAFGFDPTRPGQGPLRVEMFEQVATVFKFVNRGGKKPNRMMMAGDVISARTTEPVDWVGLCRAFKLDPAEVREGDRVYYKVKLPAFGPDCCLFRPDDRTVVFAGEKRMRTLLRQKTPAPAQAFAGGKDWERFLRGLLIVGFDNRDGQLPNLLKPDGPEFDPVAALFEHAELWTFGFDNEDRIAFRAVATCPDAAASEATARATETFLAAVRKEIDTPVPGKPPLPEGEERARLMARDFLNQANVERAGRSVLMRSAGPGTLADFASLVASGVIK